MLKILISSLLFILQMTSIYSVDVTSASGADIGLSAYSGKKLLIVNIATSGNKVSQLGELQQLQDRYSDSLVVIAVPSNSFGHESKSSSEIKSFCETYYHTTFLITQKGAVKGPDILPLYTWLTHKSENAVTNGEIKADFQKYLIDGEGHVIGIYSGTVTPLDTTITHRISETE
jgi:glutathione peroxidase